MESTLNLQPSMRDILSTVFKRKVYIALFFIVTVSIVTLYIFNADPMYESKISILVKIGRDSLYASPSGGETPFVRFDFEEQINSEIELLKSRSLIDKIIETVGLNNIYKEIDYPSAVSILGKSLSIVSAKKSNVINVSYRHKDPEMAMRVLDTYANSYFDQHLNVHKNPESDVFFEEQTQTLKTRLNESEERLNKFKKQHNITELEEEKRLLLQQISNLRAQLNNTVSEEIETENRINQLKKQLRNIPERIISGERTDHNHILISNLEARLVELELEEKDLLTKYTPQSRLVKNIEEEIKLVKSKLEEQEYKRYGNSQTGPNVIYQRLKEEYLRCQVDKKALLGKKESQKNQMKNLQANLGVLNQVEVELNQLQTAVDINRQNYRLYFSKYEENRISNAMDNKKITNVSLIEPPHFPLKPVSPKVHLTILIGILLGLFGGFGSALIIEYFDDDIETPEDVEKELQLPVIASIPEFNNK